MGRDYVVVNKGESICYILVDIQKLACVHGNWLIMHTLTH